jgi:hypothetical protein
MMVNMKTWDTEDALNQLKKLPFAKSWLNVHVSKIKKILNTETEELADTELGDFIYVPAPSFVRHFGNDKDFLRFRTEYKNSGEWNYKLLSDAAENNNRRLGVMWAANILQPLGINFLIDDGYNTIQKFPA